eukprot:gene8837-11928_t
MKTMKINIHPMHFICILCFVTLSVNAFFIQHGWKQLNSKIPVPAIHGGQCFKRFYTRVAPTTRLRSAVDQSEPSSSLPDKLRFNAFYRLNIFSDESEMSKDTFLQYDKVAQLLDSGAIFLDDVDALWTATVGDASGLNFEEAFELLCMVHDLPDPDDTDYLDESYQTIGKGSPTIKFEEFIKWSDVKEMLKEKVMTKDKLKSIWNNVAKESTTINRDQFTMINNIIDEEIEKYNNEDEDSTNEDDTSLPSLDETFKLLTKGKPTLSFFDFLGWDEVKELIEREELTTEELTNIWKSVANDLNSKINYEQFVGLNDAIELFINPLGPSSDDTLDRNTFLNEAFNTLAAGKTVISFFDLLNWDEIKELINEEAVTSEDITASWKKIAKDLDAKISLEDFIKLNDLIDDLLDPVDDEEDSVEEDTKSLIDETELQLQPVTSSIVNVWEKKFDAYSMFDDEVRIQITEYFNEVTSLNNGKLSYSMLLEWQDIRDLLDEGDLTIGAVKQAWNEATNGNKNGSIDYDTFLRLNVRLDLLMDDIEAKKENTKNLNSNENQEDEDAEKFYRKEFKKLTEGGRLLRLDLLLSWQDINDLIVEGTVTERQITRLFDGLPKEPMGIPSTVFGITEDTFVAFNSMLDVLIDATGPTDSNKTENIKKETPSLLTSEPALPMSKKEKELKIGSLVPTKSDEVEDDAGLSESEFELMQLLDKADNMLNSGSYSDFDALIGDLNDPRLSALREKRDGAEEVRGQLKDILTDLLSLGKKQKRCGLDRPGEEEEARIRDLAQAVIEKAPRLSSLSIPDIRTRVNGKWKLLYTNSEMFSFYNGVTGFANVFPASKFQDLSMEFNSDGYLSEAKYFEKLSTPLGDIDATVFTTWDLMKEMSFMTNENSVVLRNYCTKVTAGPMEYEAQENWKSLRTMSMNELMFIDDNIMITRNCGALRIYFVYQRI